MAAPVELAGHRRSSPHHYQVAARGLSHPGRHRSRRGATTTPEWQSLLDETVSEAERILIRALASADPRVPVPLLGYETDGGEVLDLAWEGHRIGVLLDESVTEATTMADTGWTLCPPEAAQIVAVLKTNGVL